ncbi:MAG: phenylalanine--tRNA ligase subunit beta [Anaerolineae bacterium]|nr:phenylalanine--tRNA ligase subunit beta [Anaerolineae bacterium]MDW8101839.1 phenylalanine--tRNA ligase subunit beta [Anaerolineae bacterium]
MRVPLSWLKDYVEIKLPPEELSYKLTMAGFEVAEIHRVGEFWDRDKVFVGQILEVKPHPNADRLTIAVVDYGASEPVEVVTGAPNIKVGQRGQKVALALAGARLVDPYSPQKTYFTLKPAKIRGVLSPGMVCSEKELDLSEDHESIIILPDDAPVGMPLADYLGDIILEIEVPTNRPDCLSILGIAREVAALTDAEFRPPTINYVEDGPGARELIEVEIADPDLCSRYAAAVVLGAEIGPSPYFVQRRLRAAGMRPINNVVDATNYVMLELGQPIHAFDYDKIRGKKIIVRRAKDDRAFTTLDGLKRELFPDVLLIADAEGPVAIAGVMGGMESEVTPETRNILIESANFNRVSIRRTSRLLGLRTEASLRFEKGLDPYLPPEGARRTAQLIKEWAGGTIARGLVDVHIPLPPRRTITFHLKELERFIGMSYPREQVTSILNKLGFELEEKGPQTYLVTVPTHRGDVEEPADLVEEIARITGYELIPTEMIPTPTAPQIFPELLKWEETARDILIACGLYEVKTYALISQDMLDKFGLSYQVPLLSVANPMTPEHVFLRPTLLPSLLRTLAYNLRFHEGVKIFELARVYLPRENDLPRERSTLAIAMAGEAEEMSWFGGGRRLDFFDLKGVIEELVERMGISDYRFTAAQDRIFFPGQTAALKIGEETIGILGKLNPDITEAFEVKEEVFMAELNFEALASRASSFREFKPISRYPAVIQDIAVVVNEEIPAEEVRKVIIEAGQPLLRSAVLFDLYRGKPVPPGKKSLAYSLTFQADDHTLTDEEVAQLREKVIRELEKRLGATLRG